MRSPLPLLKAAGLGLSAWGGFTRVRRAIFRSVARLPRPDSSGLAMTLAMRLPGEGQDQWLSAGS